MRCCVISPASGKVLLRVVKFSREIFYKIYFSNMRQLHLELWNNDIVVKVLD